ncbi:formylglycine-generating enzyme family protein [Synergistes jonesii]|uniref:formylglycine-generating enzyme family protein n=1 Tax=Synergistes jonesii TaxID=2754 RepID=UPI00248DF7A6|nr:formylglycine-generating enzyme family protein [Synergistes jonesii]
MTMRKIFTAALLLLALAAQAYAAGGLVLVKGGAFRMGSPSSEAWREKDEGAHEVTVSDFYIGRYEVTQREYRELMGEKAFSFRGDNLPVENVSWYDAVNYCNALSRKEGLTPTYAVNGRSVSWNRQADGYRLPTEAEWEYACRAGTDTPFWTGANITPEEADYYGTYPYVDGQGGEYRGETVPVDSFAPNRFGLYNVHGNVGEWCWDIYGAYDGERKDPSGAERGRWRVTRGGGWNDFGKHLRSAYRSAMPPDTRVYNIGFRVARNVK